jgi:transcriptional regulator with XRE-family HTH domain
MNMFPARLRALRKGLNLTAKELGAKFNLAESTISGYETGARKPDTETLEKFADFFGVSTDYLLGRTDDPTPPSEKQIDLSELRESAVAYLAQNSHAGARLNDAETTIKLIEEEAQKLGMSPSDPEFQKMLSHAFDLLRMARGENPK